MLFNSFGLFFMFLLLSADLLQKILSGTPSECQNGLDQSTSPDLDPNCLQRSSALMTSHLTVNQLNL